MKLKIIFFFGLLGTLFFSGCIPVDDISGVWNEGFLDSDLEGHWKKTGVQFRSQDQYISFLKKEKERVYEIENTDAEYSHQFEDFPPVPNAKARCLSVNGWGVLVVDVSDITKRFAELDTEMGDKKEATDIELQNGALELYKIKDDELSLYRLKSNVLENVISTKRVDGVIDPNEVPGFRFKKTDLDTIEYITTLADQDANIEHVITFERVPDLQEALKLSKEYPSKDQTPQNTQIDVNFPELTYFAEGKTHILLDQLQASPEWHVKDYNGEIVASRRTYKNGKWQGGYQGYESTFDNGIYDGEGFYQIRDLFRFSKEPYGFHAVWAKADHVMRVKPEAGNISLNLKLNDQGVMSYIAIGQEGLWYECYEQRKEEPRIHTRKALAWLKTFLKDVKKAEKEIQQNGHAKDLLPKNSIKTGEPSIDIQESSERRHFTISAWVNPQKSGYVYLKLFDPTTNKQQSAPIIKFTTNEFIGYSSNPNELFSYNCSISDYDDEWDHFNAARIEIWFHPNDGGQEVKLIEATSSVQLTV